MRRRVLLTTAMAVTLGLAGTAWGQTKEFSRTVPLEPGGTLTVESRRGSLRLESWDRDEVEVRARIEASRGTNDEYARRAVEATVIEVTTGATSVRVRTDYEDVPYRDTWFDGGSRSLPQVHYEIRAPRSLNLEIETDRSDSDIRGFDGRIWIEADRGRLELTDLTGDLRITVDRAPNATVTGVRGSIDLEVDRSDVIVRDLRVERRSRLEIDRGDARLDLPSTEGLTISADLTRRASFESDFPVLLDTSRGRAWSARINEGGPELLIDADRANVRIRELP